MDDINDTASGKIRNENNNETKIPDISRDYGEYRSDITKRLIETLKDIHFAGIAHNAIRPDSIFIKIQDGHVIVKFANFELSCSTVDCPDVKNGDPQDAPYERFVEMHKEKFTKFFRNRDDTAQLLEKMWKNYLKRADWYALFACIYFMWTGKHTKADFINLSRLPETEREALKQIAIELKLDLKYFKFNRWYQRWYQRWFQ
jgi:serine/threonine protein kinase